MKRWKIKDGHANVFFSPHIRKFLRWSSPQIANPQICKEKNSVSDPDQHWFASIIFIPTLVIKYILDYETPCTSNSVSKLSQKPKLVHKFEWKYLSLH